MAAMNENVALLKEAYAQWADHKGSDCECWMSIMADDASLRSLANGAPEMEFTTRRNSKAEIRGYLEGLTRDWEMVNFDMNDFVADGDRVVVIGRVAWRNKVTGKVADTPKVDIWRFRTVRQSTMPSSTTPPAPSRRQRRESRSACAQPSSTRVTSSRYWM
jgi:uncharacterized protein